MSELSQLFSTGLSSTPPEQAAISLLLAFVLGRFVAAVYERTYQGLSYSRSFVQSLVLGAIVSTILMLAIGDNLARGLGILGTMALVRFRTNVRDSRDMIFVFAALAVGVSCGVQAYAIATLGTTFFCGATYVVDWTPFGRAQRFDGMLRFWLPQDGPEGDELRKLLDPHCSSFVLVALRDVAQGGSLEYAYQIRLRGPNSQESLIKTLSNVPGVGGLTLLLQDAHTEL